MILLAPDLVTLYPAAPREDGHGWRLPGAVPAWSGPGSLQGQQGASSPLASDRGGAGPNAPAWTQVANLYLPPEAEPAEGMTAEVRGERWVLSQVRLVEDPRGTGDVSCYVATATLGGPVAG